VAIIGAYYISLLTCISMSRIIFNRKPIINKRNGQINLSLPKGKMPKDLLDKILFDKKAIKVIIEELR